MKLKPGQKAKITIVQDKRNVNVTGTVLSYDRFNKTVTIKVGNIVIIANENEVKIVN